MAELATEADPRLTLYDQWLAVGIERGWVSFPVCATHDTIPMTGAEETTWDEGGDPCQVVLRVWAE